MAHATVIFHRLAATEYRAARDWYDHHSASAGERFRAAVSHAADRIARDPDAFAQVSGEFRAVRVHRFPYVLIFRRREPTMVVMVVAVAHTSRRPGYWKRRK